MTAEAADAVVMDSSLRKVDELMHIARRTRSIALQTAVGGMILSGVGMLFAAGGYLPPLAGRHRTGNHRPRCRPQCPSDYDTAESAQRFLRLPLPTDASEGSNRLNALRFCFPDL